MLLRDNASNGVKACKDWGINHFGCVAHCLHLIVGPFLLCSKKEEDDICQAVAAIIEEEQKQHARRNNEDMNEDDEDDVDGEDGDIAPYADPFSSSDEFNIKYCRVVVNKVRTIVRFVHKSSKAKAKLTSFNGGTRCNLLLDVRTRWNSSYDMLVSFLNKRASVELFLSYMTTAAGIAVFGNKVEILTPAEWAILDGLEILLDPFKECTKMLSGNAYPSFALAIPSLFDLLSALDDDKIFLDWKYRGPDRVAVLAKLKACQQSLLASSQERLERMVFGDGEMFWVSYLDPRFRDGHILKTKLDRWEQDKARLNIIEEACKLAKCDQLKKESQEASTSVDHPNIVEATTPPRRKRTRKGLFSSPAPASDDDEEFDGVDRLQRVVEAEVDYYMKPVVGRGGIDPQIWWKENKKEFPNLSRVARKWLGVCATSTASERVFSSCGIALNAKRSRLKGTTLEAQVKLKYNIDEAAMSIDEIAQTL